MLKMKNCNSKCVIAAIVGVSAAVLGIGGYLLHKKSANRRKQEQARRLYDDYDDYEYEDEDGDEAYVDSLFGDFDDEGFYKLANDIKREDNDV